MMKRSLSALLCVFVAVCCAGCGGSSALTQASSTIVRVANSFATVEASGVPITLRATVSGDSANQGVTWTLSLAGTACSPACGTLIPAPAPSLTAVYTPPATAPQNQEATITARSLAAPQQVFVFNFQIFPPIDVRITSKFQSVNVAGPVQNLTATLSNDINHAGLAWTLTAGGVDCQNIPQGCGTLTVDPTRSLTAHYQPPATPPSLENASPTITASSVADNSKKDSFTFKIVTPPISVTILNKFAKVFTGGQPITLNASLTNDFLNEGVVWTITSAGAPCTTCGTLTPLGSPSTSATYTPPSTAQATPATITATSVSDGTKSDSFSFKFVSPLSLLVGQYAFLLHGYDQALNPMALAGSLTADGMGNITGGEYDLNDNTAVTAVTPLSGSYTVDSSFAQIPRVTFNLTGGGTTRVLKCALSSDGKRGKLIELDGSMVWNAGTLLSQDPNAVGGLANSTTPMSFAFGLDSDAPVNFRVVEAGQFILGAGATQITGGVADEGQAGAVNPVFGGLAGAAVISTASSFATPPDASGRGTLTLSIAGGANQYAYYVVNSSQLNLIEIDAGTGIKKTVQAGTARNQSALSSTSNQATSVVALTGINSSGSAPLPDVIIGVLSNPSGTAPLANFDTNNAGIPATQQTSVGSIAVPYDASTGRAVISGAFFPDAVVYFYNIGAGFLADITPSTNGLNQGFSGSLVLQSAPSGGFTQASLSGNAIGLAGASSSPFLANLDVAGNFAGNGTFSAKLDYTLAGTIPIPPQGTDLTIPSNVVSCDCRYRVEDAQLGRGELILFSSIFSGFPNHSDIVSFYLIGPNQFVALEDAGASPSSGILFFESQTQAPNN